MTNAFIIVDVQNDFTEGGALAVTGGAQVAADITTHLATTDYDVLVTTQDWHVDPGAHWSRTPDFVDTWPVHCAAETEGADYHPAVKPALAGKDVVRVFKGQYEAAYSGFEGRTLDGHKLADVLRTAGVTDVTIVGIATDHCVAATVQDAKNAGFNVTVIADLTAGVDPARTAFALQDFAAMTNVTVQ